MKVNREMVCRAGLLLLNQAGLEELTLRALAKELNIQAPTVYWHFASKQALIDEMATLVLAGGAGRLVPARETCDWKAWVRAFGTGLRETLLQYRDGARMVAGSRLTNTEYMATVERIAGVLVGAGFSVRRTAVLLSTVYNYTLSFVMEEQAVFPIRHQRSAQYDIAARKARLDPKLFPLMRQSGPILFDGFDRRYKEGLELIVAGAERQGLTSDQRRAKSVPK